MPANEAGLQELMSIDDCALTMSRWVGNARTEIPVAVVRDVSVARSRENKYMNTWGTQDDVFFVRGRMKVTGKFTFFALTPELWQMLTDMGSEAGSEVVYSIYGTFTDDKYTGLQYTCAIEGVIIESDDFAFNLDNGPGDVTLNYRAKRVTYDKTAVT